MQDFWVPSRDYIRVFLKDLETEAHVGLHPWEQYPERPTRLLLNIEMFAYLPPDRKHHSRESIVDYDLIRNAIKKWPERPHTPLLETLAEEIVELCFRHSNVEACRISIIKPDIFNEAGGAGIEIYRVKNS